MRYADGGAPVPTCIVFLSGSAKITSNSLKKGGVSDVVGVSKAGNKYEQERLAQSRAGACIYDRPGCFSTGIVAAGAGGLPNPDYCMLSAAAAAAAPAVARGRGDVHFLLLLKEHS